jgi:FkbM family methyltransferase
MRLPENRRRVIHTRINGHELLVIANEDVGRLIHFGGSYERAETDFLRSVLRPDSICMDVGANVGYYTLFMSRLAGAGAVHAFEPIALNAALLKASLELNGCTNVVINECAVAERSGTVQFSQASDTAYSSMVDTGRKSLDRVTQVPAVTLDEYVELKGINRVDVLKVDVEGAEESVVRGASRLLGDGKRRPGLVFLELFEENLKPFGSSVASVMGRMTGLGYEPFVIGPSGSRIPFRKEMASSYYNVMFVPASDRPPS